MLLLRPFGRFYIVELSTTPRTRGNTELFLIITDHASERMDATSEGIVLKR